MDPSILDPMGRLDIPDATLPPFGPFFVGTIVLHMYMGRNFTVPDVSYVKWTYVEFVCVRKI